MNQSDQISEDWITLCSLLKQALQPVGTGQTETRKLTQCQWESIVEKAKKHSVLPLLYERLKEEKTVPSVLFRNVQNISRRTVLQSYKLLYLTNYIVKLLEQGSVSVVVLKGVATAELYPYPELRKSGDIDLLLPKREELVKASGLLEAHGFSLIEKQNANHHVVYESKEGIAIELHTMLAEPFDHPRVNRYLQQLIREYDTYKEERDILGSKLPVPQTAYHAYYLLIHMLQHFMASGFGLKLLCDWVVLWNRETRKEEQQQFLQLVKDSGVHLFAECITAIGISYLGLEEARVSFLRTEAISEEDRKNMLLEILESEEFGKSDNNRLVILRGTTPADYIRELHHQMQLNYPKGGKHITLWPVLWVCTLGKFLYNNRVVRRTSLSSIIQKAHARSKQRWYTKYFI